MAASGGGPGPAPGQNVQHVAELGSRLVRKSAVGQDGGHLGKRLVPAAEAHERLGAVTGSRQEVVELDRAESEAPADAQHHGPPRDGGLSAVVGLDAVDVGGVDGSPAGELVQRQAGLPPESADGVGEGGRPGSIDHLSMEVWPMGTTGDKTTAR